MPHTRAVCAPQELPSADPDALTAMLQQRLVMTRYNGWLYSFSGISETLTIDSQMPSDRRRLPKSVGTPSGAAHQDTPLSGATTDAPEQDGEKERTEEEEKAAEEEGMEEDMEEEEGKAAEEGGMEEDMEEEEEAPLTFREYYA